MGEMIKDESQQIQCLTNQSSELGFNSYLPVNSAQ